ncbi:MAG: histidine phosphatase family protein [Actinomycetota bacterium]|nr:histidine phosphatase family protein [Actinomycetota bacterium]
MSLSSSSLERTLVLVRHAKAEQVPGKADHDRSLTSRGHHDAEAAGRWLHEQGVVPELVICSTSQRTRETWSAIAHGGCHTEYVEYRRAAYEGGTRGLLRTIREDAGEVGTLVVVGHAPTVPELASLLTDGSGSVDAHRALAEGYPTCGVSLLRVEGEWVDLDVGIATLERFHVARA